MDDLLAEFERPRPVNPEDKERRRRLFAAFGIAGLSLVALGSLTTNALFTDSDSVDSSGFTTGTIDVAANPTTTIPFGAGNMAPGDTVYGAVSVNNAGTLGLRYRVSATADNTDTKNLRDQLDFSVYTGVAPGSCDAAGVAGATLVGSSGPIGASKTFSNFGDDVRLAAGASDDLCVVASLDLLSTGNAFQDATTTVTFVFDAEQTKNN